MLINIERKHYETPLGSTKTYYYDLLNLRDYRRISGGIAWPFAQESGFVCVVSEDYQKDARLKKRHCRLLDEYTDFDVEKLIRRMYDFQNRYLIDMWYGDPDNELMGYFLDRFNQALPKKKGKQPLGLFIAAAPFADDPHNFRMYAHAIKSRIGKGKKSLHFGDKSTLPGILSGLSPDSVQKDGVQEYPIIAGLGFALAGMDEPWADVSSDRELHERHVTRRAVVGL